MAVNITRFKTKKLRYGVTDSINTKFILDSRTDPEMKVKMDELDKDCPSALYNPFLNLEGTVVGFPIG